MKPLDRVLCATAGLLGLGIYVVTLRSNRPSEVLVGIGALVAGLTICSLAGRSYARCS